MVVVVQSFNHRARLQSRVENCRAFGLENATAAPSDGDTIFGGLGSVT